MGLEGLEDGGTALDEAEGVVALLLLADGEEDVDEVRKEVDGDEVGVLGQALQDGWQHGRVGGLLDHPEVRREHAAKNLALL